MEHLTKLANAYWWLWMRWRFLRRMSLYVGIIGRCTWAEKRCGPILAWQIARAVHPKENLMEKRRLLGI